MRRERFRRPGLVWFIIAAWLFVGYPAAWQQPRIPRAPAVAEAALNDMILLWEEPAIPSGWECLSCTATGSMFGVFPVASSSYGTATSGQDIHSHTFTTTSDSGSLTTESGKGGSGSVMPVQTDPHRWQNVSSTPGDVRPPFRNLQFIRRAATTTLPAGVIGMFSVASTSSLPSGWSYYTPMENRYLRGESATTTGGAATHQHFATSTIQSGSSTLSSGSGSRTVASAEHGHTISTTSAATNLTSNNQQFATIIFAKLTATSTMPKNLIAFFDNATLPTDWVTFSTSGSPYVNRFLVGSSTAGVTGGSASSTHNHGGSITALSATTTSSGGANNGGTTLAAASHSHSVTFSVSGQTFLPVNRHLIMGRYNADPLFEQSAYRWFQSAAATSSASTTYGFYRKPITVSSTMVSSTHSNFPVLVASTSTDLKHTSFGGNVASLVGNDITFVASDGTTKLSHEIERYTPGTGEIVAWVKIPSFSSSTSFYLYYGSSTAPNQQDPTNVWDSNYVLVQHLEETAGTVYTGSTANANNGTSTGTGVPSPFFAGRINGAQDFDGGDDFIEVQDSNSLDLTSNVTISGWAYPTTIANDVMRVAGKLVESCVSPWDVYSLGKLDVTNAWTFDLGISSVRTRVSSTQTIATNAWTYLVGTYDGATMSIYVNGALSRSKSQGGSIGTNAAPFRIGRDVCGGQGHFPGRLDEIRVSSSTRSAAWILTEYNNQSSPGTFFTIGGEEKLVDAPVGPPLAAANTSTTLAAASSTFRLRMLLHVSKVDAEASGQSFKLQVATSTPGACDPAYQGETYTDVATSSGAIRFSSNPPAFDGIPISSTSSDPMHEDHTIWNQTYEEVNPFTNQRSVIPVNTDGKWDFSLVDAAAPAGATYCFRVVKSDNSLITTSTATKVPEIRTPPPLFEQSGYRWFSHATGTSFGVGGATTSNPTTGNDLPQGIAVNPVTGNIYTVGYDVSGSGPSRVWRYEARTATGSLIQSFGIGGATTSDPTNDGEEANDIALNTTSGVMYAVGHDITSGNQGWRIEARNISDGTFVSSFGASGVSSTNPSANDDKARGIALNPASGTMYVAGFDSTPAAGNREWRIVAANLSDGSTIWTSSTDYTNPQSDYAYNLAANQASGTIYVVGSQGDGAAWRMVAVNMADGATVWSTSTSPAGGAGEAADIAINPASGTAYIVGYERVSGSDYAWRIEARNLSDGTFVSSFGVGGATTSNPTADDDTAYEVAVDPARGMLYVVGYQWGGSGSDYQWRIEGRNLSDGAFVFAAKTSNPSSTGIDTAQAIAVHPSVNAMYVVGDSREFGADQAWRFEKRTLSGGDLVSGESIGPPLAAANTSTTLAAASSTFRLRMLLHVSSTALALSGESFKLQVATSTPGGCDPAYQSETYADVSSSSGAIRYNVDPFLQNGSAISATTSDPGHDGHTNRPQTYQDRNPFTNSVSAVSAGDDGLWDFSLVDAAAPAGATYCFRVVKSDNSLITTSTATKVPEVKTAVALGPEPPVVSGLSLNGGSPITLTEGTTTSVSVVGTATDPNGSGNLSYATSVIYRSGAGAGCTASDLSCYRLASSSCAFSGCSGNSCTVTCTAYLWYFADATDSSSTFSGQTWDASVTAVDQGGLSGASTTPSGVVLNTLAALSVTTDINYGSLSPGQNTGLTNQVATTTNTGNSKLDVEFSGGALILGAASITSSAQRYGTSSADYGSLSFELTPTSSPVVRDINLGKTASSSTLSASTTYWGIAAPSGTPIGTYTGTNVFTAVWSN